jgi:integrase
MTVSKDKGSIYYRTRFSIKVPGTDKSIRIQESTGEVTKALAIRYEERRKQQIRDELVYGVKAHKKWEDAVSQWLVEMKHKRTIKQDIVQFNTINQYLKDKPLNLITKELIEDFAQKRERIITSRGAPPTAATINRYLALIKSVLNKAYKEWGWIDKIPHIRMRVEPKYRDVWLTPELAVKLSESLIKHNLTRTLDIMYFAIATFLRKDNILSLKWSQVHLTPNHEFIYIHNTDFKNATNFKVPLNKSAIEIIKRQIGKHPEYVFTFKGKPLKNVTTRMWRKALIDAGIRTEQCKFRFHDLRHTGATWFLLAGGTLHELMGCGGWKDIKSVMKYAHWANEYLRTAITRTDPQITKLLEMTLPSGQQRVERNNVQLD